MFLQRVYLYIPVVYLTMLYEEVYTTRRIIGSLMNDLLGIKEKGALFQPPTNLALAWKN
jgi:hypothetical protein